MRPEHFFMPVMMLMVAGMGPALLFWCFEEALRLAGEDRGSRWALVFSGAAVSALASGAMLRVLGPTLVGTPRAAPSLVAAALTLSVGLLATHHYVGRLPAASSARLGAAVGMSVAGILVLSAAFLWQATDITVDDARRIPDGFSDPVPFDRIERRARLDPWDPDLYLARAWTAVRAEHFAVALDDAETAERLGVDAIALAHLRADALAGLDECDQAREAYGRWLQLRAAEATTRAIAGEASFPIESQWLEDADLERGLEDELALPYLVNDEPTRFRQLCVGAAPFYGE